MIQITGAFKNEMISLRNAFETQSEKNKNSKKKPKKEGHFLPPKAKEVMLEL